MVLNKDARDPNPRVTNINGTNLKSLISAVRQELHAYVPLHVTSPFCMLRSTSTASAAIRNGAQCKMQQFPLSCPFQYISPQDGIT